MNRGFSLVEVMVTTAIVGISAAAIMSTLKFQADSSASIRTQEIINSRITHLRLILSDPATCTANLGYLKKKSFVTAKLDTEKISIDRISPDGGKNDIVKLGTKTSDGVEATSMNLTNLVATANPGVFVGEIVLHLKHTGSGLTKQGLYRSIPVLINANVAGGVATIVDCSSGSVAPTPTPPESISDKLGQPLYPQFVACTKGLEKALFHIGICDNLGCSYRMLLKTGSSHSVLYRTTPPGVLASRIKHNGRGKFCPMSISLDGSLVDP